MTFALQSRGLALLHMLWLPSNRNPEKVSCDIECAFQFSKLSSYE